MLWERSAEMDPVVDWTVPRYVAAVVVGCCAFVSGLLPLWWYVVPVLLVICCGCGGRLCRFVADLGELWWWVVKVLFSICCG